MSITRQNGRKNRAVPGQLKLLSKPKTREPRTGIVSFRLRKSEIKTLEHDLNSNPVAGIRSVKQFCRKLAIDYGCNRLVYVDPLDREISPDSRPIVNIESPNGKFGRRLLMELGNYLSDEERWLHLRRFMLRAGWPTDLAKEYAEATSPDARVKIVQKLIGKMLDSQEQT